MSKKRGLSAEEKKQRMLEIFYEKPEFYQIKELEKIAPKEKGIVAQTVKDVIQALIDDGLVDSEKIGTSIYFWAFPSKVRQAKKQQLVETKAQLGQLQKKRQQVQQRLELAQNYRIDDELRRETLQHVKELEAKHNTLLVKLEKYKDCDVEALEALENESKEGKEAANRWTDNIFSVKSWCKTKFNIEGKTLDKQFEIPEEMDYLE